MKSTPSNIQIKKLVKKYKDVTITYDDLVITSKITWIIGDNASGKSTLLKALSRNIKTIGDINIPSKPLYLPESVVLPDEVIMIEYITTMLTSLKIILKTGQLDSIISLLELEEHRTKKIKSLSKGTKTKLHLLPALLSNHTIKLLDEPFSGLDKNTVDRLIIFMQIDVSMYIVSSHRLGSNINSLHQVINL